MHDSPSERSTRAGVPARSCAARAAADAGLLRMRAVRNGAPEVCTATAPPRRPRAPSLALAAPKQRSAWLPYNSGLQLTRSGVFIASRSCRPRPTLRVTAALQTLCYLHRLGPALAAEAQDCWADAMNPHRSARPFTGPGFALALCSLVSSLSGCDETATAPRDGGRHDGGVPDDGHGCAPGHAYCYGDCCAPSQTCTGNGCQDPPGPGAGPTDAGSVDAAPEYAGPAYCNELQERAGPLIAAAAACGTGDECVLFGGGECLEAFLCGVSVNAASDLDLFQRQVQSLTDAWTRHCSPEGCVVAGCTLVEPRCDTRLGQCVSVLPGEGDAG